MRYSWKQFQKDFLSSIRKTKPSEEFVQQIIPSVKMINKEKPLQVYQNSYYARLTEALGETYESCWWVLGDEEFFSICNEFIRAHPSLHYNLSDYGREFPEYLYNHKIRNEIPFVFDLAHFEWSFKELFHSKQHKSINAKDLAVNAEPGDLRFKFGHACFLFCSKYSVYEIWQKRKDDQTNCFLDYDKEESLIIYKKNNRIYVDSLDKNEFFLLKGLKQGYTLGQALENHSKDIDAAEISNIFQKIISRGVVSQVDLL